MKFFFHVWMLIYCYLSRMNTFFLLLFFLNLSYNSWGIDVLFKISRKVVIMEHDWEVSEDKLLERDAWVCLNTKKKLGKIFDCPFQYFIYALLSSCLRFGMGFQLQSMKSFWLLCFPSKVLIVTIHFIRCSWKVCIRWWRSWTSIAYWKIYLADLFSKCCIVLTTEILSDAWSMVWANNSVSKWFPNIQCSEFRTFKWCAIFCFLGVLFASTYLTAVLVFCVFLYYCMYCQIIFC